MPGMASHEWSANHGHPQLYIALFLILRRLIPGTSKASGAGMIKRRLTLLVTTMLSVFLSYQQECHPLFQL